MDIKELMKPRFKLMADYPGNTRGIGSISIEEATANYFRRFPLNFDELKWWEWRDKSDLPLYVKATQCKGKFKVKKAYWSFSEKYGSHLSKKTGYISGEILPATEQEYNDYISKITITN